MGTISIIHGYIECYDERVVPGGTMAAVTRALDAFVFDEVYPFTDIFQRDSPAQYDGPVIGFCGAYKNLERDFARWLWRFTELLRTLPAVGAHAVLHTALMGEYAWTLEPVRPAPSELLRGGTQVQVPFLCPDWAVTKAPDDDFSNDPAFQERWAGRDIDPATGLPGPAWDKFVPRQASRSSASRAEAEGAE